MAAVYREYRSPAPLASLVACLWEQHATTPHSQLVIPDGCVDVIWREESELVVAGADTGPRSVTMPAGSRYAGIRLCPGAAGGVLGVPASELCDQEVAAELIWGERVRRLEDALAQARGARPFAVLAAAVAAQHAGPDLLVARAARHLSRPGARVATVARELGVGERTLHRRTLAAVGYGPKMLARVARLRRLVISQGPLAARAYEAGYASQAHMTEEVRRLTGATPVRFLKDAGLTAA